MNRMLSAAEYYLQLYEKVCITHLDYMKFAEDYAKYVYYWAVEEQPRTVVDE